MATGSKWGACFARCSPRIAQTLRHEARLAGDQPEKRSCQDADEVGHGNHAVGEIGDSGTVLIAISQVSGRGFFIPLSPPKVAWLALLHHQKCEWVCTFPTKLSRLHPLIFSLLSLYSQIW